MSMAGIEEGKIADDQLAKVWAGLGSCASRELLKKAVGKLLISAGDLLCWACCLSCWAFLALQNVSE